MSFAEAMAAGSTLEKRSVVLTVSLFQNYVSLTFFPRSRDSLSASTRISINLDLPPLLISKYELGRLYINYSVKKVHDP